MADSNAQDLTPKSTHGTIEALWIYPVKSMRGIQLRNCEITPEGLANDRHWMVIDEKGVFVSQRKLPSMTHINVTLTQTGIRLSHQEHGSVEVTKSECHNEIPAKVWSSEVVTLLAPSHINQWLNKALPSKHTLSLVALKPSFRRELDPQRFGNHTTYFADAAPLLIANLASLDALNDYLKHTKQLPALSMERFRPNVVVSGLPAFAEHKIKRLTFTGGEIKLIDHCQRCSMITVDPATATLENTADIFTSLASLNPMPNQPKAPAFGANAIVTQANHCHLKTSMAVQFKA